MVQDENPHAPLIRDITAMVEAAIANMLSSRGQQDQTPIDTQSRIESFLEGWYTAQDTAGLIIYAVIRCVHQHGDLVAAFDTITSLEEAIVQRLQRD